jgi:peptidylprolyl isomerase
VTSGKPTVSLPATAPTKLVSKDLRVGSGEAVQKGDTIRVKYVGVSMKTKKEFASNWGNAEPMLITGFGTAKSTVDGKPGGVIKGWEGLIGAKPGGRRQLTIPAALAGSKAGEKPAGPNEDLVYVVDVTSQAKG